MVLTSLELLPVQKKNGEGLARVHAISLLETAAEASERQMAEPVRA